MYKIAFIGSSGHLGYALDGIQKIGGATIVGVSPGTAIEPTEPLEQIADGLKVHTDYRGMLDETTPDFAVVNSHFCLQSEIAVEVLERNIHAFVEKPLACTINELDRLENTYARSQAELVTMLGLRYNPAFLAARQSVTAGAIGEVRLLHAQKSYRLGSRKDFFKTRATYGGTIPWVGIHAIDWIQWFAGQDFISVDARHSVIANSNHGELEATAACLFEMTNGVVATANIDYLRPGAADSHGDDRIRVVGSEGIVEVRDGRAILINADGTSELQLGAPGNIFADFIRKTEGTGTCLIDAEESFMATRIGLLARESADSSKPVQIN